MRLPRFKLKVWMLAALVALIAVGFAAARTARRVRVERELAAHHAQEEAACRDYIPRAVELLRDLETRLAEARRGPAKSQGDREMAKSLDEGITYWRGMTVRQRRHIDYWRRRLDYHTHVRQMHERACHFPWPRAEPDPTPPE